MRRKLRWPIDSWLRTDDYFFAGGSEWMTYSPDRDDLRQFQPRRSLGLLHELLHGSGMMRRGSTTANDSISRAIARTELVICCPAGKAAPLPAPGWHSRSSPVLALLVPTTMERSSWSRARHFAEFVPGVRPISYCLPVASANLARPRARACRSS